mmetsp:Transcript_29524/g.71933  ORF Transcript_29524/g.71933 Transcript_29524/m.71933 type:complete len:103 (-) Transcript_29524:318-626(-)
MSEFKQDMPPPGGFPKIRWKRNIPKSRISGLMLYGGFAAVTTYGMWRVVSGNKAESAKRQKLADERTALLEQLQKKHNVKTFMKVREILDLDFKSQSGGGHH